MDFDCTVSDSKSKEFRKYLENTGTNEVITSSLMKLYQEPELPEDSIAYIRKQLATDEYPDYDEILSMRSRIAKLRTEKEKTRLQLSAAKSNVKMSEEEAEEYLSMKFEALDNDPNAQSLLKEFLDEEILADLRNRKTKLRGTLLDNIRCGLVEYEHKIGIFASDQYAYETFDLLYVPVLEEVHEVEQTDETDEATTVGTPSAATLAVTATSADSGNTRSHPELDWGLLEDIVDLDPSNLFVKNVSITIGRALENVRFMPTITFEEVQDVGDKIQKVLEGIVDEEFVGKYYEFSDIKGEQKAKWIEEGILFDDPNNKFLKAAGTYSLWPLGRGLFLNEKKNIRVWVNEEEHLQVTSFNTGGNLREIYERLVKFMDFLDDLEFARDSRWGFAAHNLKNIGNTMRIVMKVKIPQLASPEKISIFESLADANDLVFKNLGCGLIEMTNKKRFGITEFDTVKKFQAAYAEIIDAEKCLYT